MSLNRLKELLDIDVPEIKGDVPKINNEELGTTTRVLEYTMAVKLLGNSFVNSILKEMNAFDKLKDDDLNSYVVLAKSVQQVINEVEFNTGVELIEDNISKHFKQKATVGGIQDFSYELAAKIYENMFTRNLKDNNEENRKPDPSKASPEEADAFYKRRKELIDRGDLDDYDGESRGTLFRKLINKLNLGDVIPVRSLSDLLGLDAVKKARKRGKQRRSNSFMSSFAAFESIDGERMHPGLVGLTLSFENTFGTDEVINILESFNSSENEGDEEMEVKKDITEASDASLNDDLKTTNVNADHPKDAPKIPSVVTQDVNKRLKEINRLIKEFEAEKHFQGTVKPAIFNAKNSLEFMMSKFKEGTMDSFKEAQIHFQTLKSPITTLFPPSLVKFLAHGGGDEELTKDV